MKCLYNILFLVLFVLIFLYKIYGICNAAM